MGHLFYATPSFVRHFVAIHEFKLELQSGNAQFESELVSFSRVTFNKYDGWPRKPIGHLFYICQFKRCASFCIAICDFKLELRSGNAQIGAKFVLTCVTLTIDLWSWPFAGTSPLSVVIAPENFIMIRWQEHCGNVCVTNRRTHIGPFIELLGHN